jgi:hypothetical protein
MRGHTVQLQRVVIDPKYDACTKMRIWVFSKDFSGLAVDRSGCVPVSQLLLSYFVAIH